MSAAPWEAVIVASDTTKLLNESRLDRPKVQTNYALRYVVERLTSYADAVGEDVEAVVLEESGRFSLVDFIGYMRRLQEKRDPLITWSKFDPSVVVTKGKREEPLLSIADGMAHAGFRALEPDKRWGQCETDYLNTVRGHLWKGPTGSQSIARYGFVLMPTSERAGFQQEYPWLEGMT
jgi:hypothetical protein